MIIHRLWIVTDWKKRPWKQTRKRTMEGWFLFGFLPLYVRTRTVQEWV